MKLETYGQKAGAMIAILTLGGMLAAGMTAYHSDYAKAEDLKSLSNVVTLQEIRRLEEDISDLEQEIAILASQPDPSQADLIKLSQLQQRRERYLQTVQELKAAR